MTEATFAKRVDANLDRLQKLLEQYYDLPDDSLSIGSVRGSTWALIERIEDELPE